MCECGKIFSRIQQLIREKRDKSYKFKKFVALTNFSLSWAYFALNFYNLSLTHTKLLKLSIPLRDIQMNFKLIKKFIKMPQYFNKWK